MYEAILEKVNTVDKMHYINHNADTEICKELCNPDNYKELLLHANTEACECARPAPPAQRSGPARRAWHASPSLSPNHLYRATTSASLARRQFNRWLGRLKLMLNSMHLDTASFFAMVARPGSRSVADSASSLARAPGRTVRPHRSAPPHLCPPLRTRACCSRACPTRRR